MLYDANLLDESFKPQAYDLCIAGGGAAGISIANAFNDTQFKVCLLEGGGDQFQKESQDVYKGRTSDLPYRVQNSRLRFLGGTTNHWSGYCSPYDASDFEESWFSLSGWPISEQELKTYYTETSEILELLDSDFEPSYWENKLGKFISFKGNEVINKMTLFSKPVRFGEKYKAALEKSSNVDLFLNTNVVDILLSDDVKNVKEIFAKSWGDKKFTFRAKNTVLACGGIENARLLLNFRAQMEKGVGNQNDQVGRYFMEHLHWRNKHSPMQAMINPVENFSENYRYTSSSSIRPPLIKWQIHPEIRSQKRLANAYVHEVSDFVDTSSVEENLFNMHEKIKGKKGSTTKEYIMFSEQLPNPESRVLLSDKRCALGLNRTKLKWSLLKDDLRSVTDSLKIFAGAIGKNGLGNARIQDWALAGEYLSGLEGAYHHIGTTRMSSSPANGVVDENCKIHGINNLFIAGSSVFPTGGAVQPTFTIVALALRLSDHLKKLF